MKTSLRKAKICLILSLFCSAISGKQEVKSQSASMDYKKESITSIRNTPRDFKNIDQEIRLLRKFLDMPPARLKVLRRTLERMEGYTEEERRQMRIRLSKLQEESSSGKSRIMEGFVKRQQILKVYWSKLPVEKRKEEMANFYSMTGNERKEYLNQLSQGKESSFSD